jgi:chemotaxis protein MotB
VAVLLFVLGLSSWQRGREADHARSELAAARAALETNSAYAAGLNDDLAASKTRIAQLQKEKEAVTLAQKNLEQEMRASLESKDITISQLQGRLTVNILDRILFDSGEAVLKPDGEGVLQKLASILAQYPNRQIHVIGHTDNVPIRPTAKGKFASNWELSTARATAAVRFLCERAAVDPRRLGAVGYGEFHPVADNATAEGRARNRRIALVVMPEELAGVDVPKSTAPTPPRSVDLDTKPSTKEAGQNPGQ